MARVFIGLGSNLGNRQLYIDTAYLFFRNHSSIELLEHTPSIETEPWGVKDQPPFLNSVALLRTTLLPTELLDELQRAEKSIGRQKSDTRWGPREIDLDILLYGATIINTPNLVIPHKELKNRPFVLKQILVLDENTVDPVSQKKLARFL